MCELKRVLFNKKVFVSVLLLIALCIGFFVYGEFHNTQDIGVDFLRLNYHYKQEIDKIKNMNLSSATDEIENKLLHISILNDLASYEKVKTENYDDYAEFWVNEELKIRNEYPDYAAEYDESKDSIDMTELYAQKSALQEISAQLNYISSYFDYLSGIDSKAEQMNSISVFSEVNPLSDKNIKKTVSDYSGLKNITLSIGNDKPIMAVVDFKLVHYLIFAFSLVVIFIFSEERKRGLNTVVFSTFNGRTGLAIKRTGILVATVTAINIVTYGLLFSVSFLIYGGEEFLLRNIQSIELFKSFTLQMTEIEFILFYVLVNILTDLCLSFVIWFIVAFCKNTSLALGITGILFGAEFLIYSLVPVQSNLALIKYINASYFIDCTEAVIKYININAFVTVFNLLRTIVISAIVISIIVVLLCVFIYGHKYPNTTPNKIEIYISNVFSKLKVFYWSIVEKLSPLGMELYKILIMQKGIIVLFVLGFVLFSFTTTDTIYYSSTDSIVNDFYSEHAGELDGEVLEYVKSLENEISLIDTSWQKASQDYSRGIITYEKYQIESLKNDAFDSKRKALAVITEQIDYIENSDYNAHIVNPRGYEKLLGESGFSRQQIYALVSLLSVIIILSRVFAFERRLCMQYSLLACSRGRSYLLKKKFISASIICVIIWLLAVCTELYDVRAQYNLGEINAPLKSLSFLSELPYNPSILSFIVIMYLLRLTMLLSVSYMICFVSLKTRYEICLLISTIVLILPSLLYWLGMHLFSFVSLSSILAFSELAVISGYWILLPIIIILAIGTICVVFSKRIWCRKSR